MSDCIFVCVYVWFETVGGGVLYECISVYQCVCMYGCETVSVCVMQERVSVWVSMIMGGSMG